MSSANCIIVFEVWMGVQSWVNSVKMTGLNTQPCGVPVFTRIVDEVLFLILTC